VVVVCTTTLIVDRADLYTARSGDLLGPALAQQGAMEVTPNVEAGRDATIPVECGECGSRTIGGDRWSR
jgi:hypothetical protein